MMISGEAAQTLVLGVEVRVAIRAPVYSICVLSAPSGAGSQTKTQLPPKKQANTQIVKRKTTPLNKNVVSCLK